VADQYQRKEASYKELIRSLSGFYDGAQNPLLIRKFLEELNIAWLYCPERAKADALREAVEKVGGPLSRIQMKRQALYRLSYPPAQRS